MAIKCPQCGAEYDVTLFTFGRRIRCECGAWVDVAVGHQQTSADGKQAVSSPGIKQDASTSSDNPFAPATRAHRGILWLVVVHVVVGMVAAFVASTGDRFTPTLPQVVFLGIVFSQTSMLGIWGSLGTTPWQTRLIGVFLCVGYLAPLLGIGIHEVSIETFIVVVTATLFVVLPLLIVRHFRVAIHRDSSPVAPPGRVQFSIRHLMILTFVIACLMSIGKLVRPVSFLMVV